MNRGPPEEQTAEGGPGNLSELPGQVGDSVSRSCKRSLGAQGAEGAVALKGLVTLSTACVRDKERGLESSRHLQARGLQEKTEGP